MSQLPFTILAFVVAIGVLVTVHEFGHFWVARRLGIKVLRFSIGFGRSLWTHVGRDGTEYVLAALPLGGYVKMLDEHEGEVAEADRPFAFNRQPLASRAAVVCAGPLFNFLFAVVAYWLIFVIGVTGLRPLVGSVTDGSPAADAGLRAGDEILQVNDTATPTLHGVRVALLGETMAGRSVVLEVADEHQKRRLLSLDLTHLTGDVEGGDPLAIVGISPWQPSIPPVVGEVVQGEVADRAGLRAGDRIVSADGTPIADWSAWVEYVQARPDTPIAVAVTRDGRPLTLTLRPAAVKAGEKTVGRIGALNARVDLSAYTAVLTYPPLQAVGAAISRTWEMSALTLRVLGRLATGQASLSNVSGPLTIAQYAGESARIGLVPFLGFLAVVSISLGVLNLLPVPVLDGGHLLYYLIELAKGSPLSEQAQMLGQRVGIVLLLGLMALAFYNDFVRLLG